MNYRLTARLLGYLLLAFSLSMVAIIPFALVFREFGALIATLESMLIGGALGGVMVLFGRGAKGTVFRHEALAVVGLSWILASLLGALPFYLGGLAPSLADAYFESASGLTTTGASILAAVDNQPHSLLFWRSFLHFIGGLGIVVIFVAVLPILGVGGKALYKQEVSGPRPEGLTPRIKDTALTLFKVYLALNIIHMVVLLIAGMSFFDALNHAMSTIASGGFSTQNASIASYGSRLIEWIIIVFMFIAGTNFMLHVRFSKGDFLCYFRDIEFRAYLAIVLVATVFFAGVLWLLDTSAVSSPGGFNFRDALFTTLTVMTTTGYGTVDFAQWPPVCQALILFLMFVGGMAGSTAGGMKVIRSLIFVKSAAHQLQTEANPRIVRVLKIGNRTLDRRAFSDAFALFFLWITVFVAGTIIVALLSPDQSFLTSLSASASCLNNIGPGLDGVGPTANYASQHPAAKWVLSLMMIMGRLELYVILIILTPGFWLGR